MADNSAAFDFKLPNQSSYLGTGNQQQQPQQKQIQSALPQMLDDDLLQTGVDGLDAYFNAYEQWDNFTMEMATKHNIDVTRPDPSQPGSIEAYRQHSRMLTELRRLANGLKVGREAQEKINAQALEGDLFTRGYEQPMAGNNMPQMTNSMSAMNYLPNKLVPEVTEFNEMIGVGGFHSNQQKEVIAQRRKEVEAQLDQLYPVLAQQYDPGYAKQYIQMQKDSLKTPSYDDSKDKDRSLDWYKATKPTESKGKEKPELIINTTEGYKNVTTEAGNNFYVRSQGNIKVADTKNRNLNTGETNDGLKTYFFNFNDPSSGISGNLQEWGHNMPQQLNDVKVGEITNVAFNKAGMPIAAFKKDDAAKQKVAYTRPYIIGQTTNGLEVYIPYELNPITEYDEAVQALKPTTESKTISLKELKADYDFSSWTDQEIKDYYKEKGYTVK